jgi:hypothetical protein
MSTISPPAVSLEDLEFTDLDKLRGFLARKGVTHVYSSAGPRPVAEWRPYPGAPPSLRLQILEDLLLEVPDPFRPRPARLLGRWRLFKGLPTGKSWRRPVSSWLA